MNNALKRLLSFAMAVVMVMSYGVMPVAAEDNGTETPTSCLGQADVECNFDAHIEGCSKYEAPVTSCQGKADVECNFDTHIEGCPKYEAPVTSCQGKADVECNFDTHIEGCSKYVAPVTCDGSENCPAEEHDEDCLCYDWCVAHGCDQDNGIHLEGCPYTIPCDLTEGCELHKGHWGDCTGIDTFEGEVVAKIGNTPYTTFSDAMTAANAKTGETVTVEIHGEVEFTNGMELNGGYTSISFEGKTENAKITVNQSAGGDYLEAHGKTVSFENLILAKANPAWSGNSGHMGNYFSLQGGTATYTNCTFSNGACTSGGTATYTGCTFRNSSEYGLWVYDDASVTVSGGTIDSAKGIKVYSEDEASITSTLKVQNATFTANITAKPAVAIGYAEKIELIGNTYNNATGVLELDSGSDADCEGVTFVAQDASGNDISNTLTAVDRSNGNASCGVLMDGKLYTTVTTAAAAAATESAEEVVIMYSTDETATFVGADVKTSEGVSAPNVIIAVAVAQVGTKKFTDVQEAIKSAVPSSTVELLTDVTVDKWVMITQSLTIGNDQLITVESINGLTIKGNNHTLTINSIESASNGNRLFYDATNLNSQDLTIKYANNVTGGIGLTSGTISNVTFEGGVGVFPGDGDITITGCTFKTSGSAIYNEEDRDNLTVTGNRFETAVGQYAIYLRGNTTFTGNTVVSGKVNVVNGSPVVTDNNFNDERFKVYNGATATISGNTINNLVFNDDTDIQATFYNNTLSDAAQAALDAVNPYVAQVVDGENVQMFTDIQEAIKTAAPDGTVTLLNDVTVDEWIMFSEHLTLAGKIHTITMNGLTIDGGTTH